MLQREQDRELIPSDEDEGSAAGPAHSRVILVDSRQQLTGSFGGWVVPERYPEPVRSDIHQAFEIGVLLTGGQKRYFEDFETVLSPGGMYLSPAWERHAWQTLEPGTYTLMIHFLPDFLGEESFEGMSWLNLFAVPPRERPSARTPETRERVMAATQEIIREVGEARRGWMAAVRLDVLKLLYLVWCEWQPSEGEDQSVEMGDLGRLAPAIDLVRSRPAARTTLDEGAKACALGRSQFSSLFRKTMGLSFGKFVSRYRVLKAAEMLLGTDSSLAQIAEELGFVDAAHLHRCFVQHYRCTPGHYRRGEHPEDVLPVREYHPPLESILSSTRRRRAPASR